MGSSSRRIYNKLLNLDNMFPKFIHNSKVIFLFYSENGNLYIVMDYCEAGNHATRCYNAIIYK